MVVAPAETRGRPVAADDLRAVFYCLIFFLLLFVESFQFSAASERYFTGYFLTPVMFCRPTLQPEVVCLGGGGGTPVSTRGSLFLRERFGPLLLFCALRKPVAASPYQDSSWPVTAFFTPLQSSTRTLTAPPPSPLGPQNVSLYAFIARRLVVCSVPGDELLTAAVFPLFTPPCSCPPFFFPLLVFS